MVQTYEGALTETDSILQRMKTLADQAANGTYQDDVDRDAIQLEFDQLNDELNQIADTDFNGVVVLNGGEMADGLKATDGKFDYSNKKDQIMALAKSTLKNDIDAANATVRDVTTAMSKENFDLTANGFAPEWNSVDNSTYDKTVADNVWKDLGIIDDAGAAKTDIVTEVEVTFQLGADGTWKALKATGNDGAEYDASKLTTAVVDGNTAADGTVDTANGLGGFTVTTTTGTSLAANAIFDATTAKAGDTVTLKFTNGTNMKLAPKNVGFAEDTVKTESTGDTDISDATISLATAAKLKDSDMTADLADKFNALNGQSVEIAYNKNTADYNPKVTIGGQELSGDQMKTTGAAITINGQSYFVKSDNDTAGQVSKITIYDKKGGKELLNIGFTKAVKSAANDTAGTIGSTKGTIALDTAQYVDSSASIRVTVGENTELGTSEKYQKQLSEARDTLAKLSEVDVTDYESAKEYLTGKGVSISDALDNATAPLTYTDHVMLQTGARSKDLVDFTFKYSTGGMGDLKANMNCSAREDGLNTANLSLKTQKDANYAIDRIDNAINKVSMVRATFGAVQNRLEHKIDNMNVTKENMTSAESRIRDTNMAEEMTNFTKNQILSQASQAMLAQANQLPQGVLQLLG